MLTEFDFYAVKSGEKYGLQSSADYSTAYNRESTVQLPIRGHHRGPSPPQKFDHACISDRRPSLLQCNSSSS